MLIICPLSFANMQRLCGFITNLSKLYRLSALCWFRRLVKVFAVCWLLQLHTASFARTIRRGIQILLFYLVISFVIELTELISEDIYEEVAFSIDLLLLLQDLFLGEWEFPIVFGSVHLFRLHFFINRFYCNIIIVLYSMHQTYKSS